VGLGQVAPLLGGGADALAEPATAGEGVEAVGGLPPGVGVVLERVGEVGDAVEPLGVGGRQRDRGDTEASYRSTAIYGGERGRDHR
jgi:hypothetical protein